MAWGLRLLPQVEAELAGVSKAMHDAIWAAFARIATDPLHEGERLITNPPLPAGEYVTLCGAAYIFYTAWDDWPLVVVTRIDWVF